MRKKISILAIGLLVLPGMLSGCGNAPSPDGQTASSGTENAAGSSAGTEKSAGETDPKATSTDIGELFTDRDFETDYDENSCTKITFSDTGIESRGDGASVDGTTVTITGDGSYLLSGSCPDGMVVVDTDAKIQLILDNLDLCRDTSAAVYVKSAGKVFLTLAEGSRNTLANTGEFAAIDDNHIDGTIFSKDDICFNGSGSLTISSETGHGIVGKDDVKFTSGDYTVSAGGHGISANDSIRIADSSFAVTAATDTLHTDGYLTILDGDFSLDSGDDALHADGCLTIQDGTLAIAKSYEGIEGDVIRILGGDTALQSEDDGINAKSSLDISGGAITITAGGDGIDSNGSLSVSGGTVCINGPVSNGDGMIDYTDQALISGGTVLAAGSMAMAQNFGEDSTQCSILLAVDSQSAGTAVTLTDSSGDEIISWTPTVDYSGVIISCAGLNAGESYTVQAGSFEETISLQGTIYGSGMEGGFGGGGRKGGTPPDGSGGGDKNGTPPGGFDGNRDENGTPPGGFDGNRDENGTPPNGFGGGDENGTPPGGFGGGDENGTPPGGFGGGDENGTPPDSSDGGNENGGSL